MCLMVMIQFLSSLVYLTFYPDINSFKALKSGLLTANLLVLSLPQIRCIVHFVLDNCFIVLYLGLNLLFLV